MTGKTDTSCHIKKEEVSEAFTALMALNVLLLSQLEAAQVAQFLQTLVGHIALRFLPMDGKEN